jgi:hypothetical protein
MSWSREAAHVWRCHTHARRPRRRERPSPGRLAPVPLRFRGRRPGVVCQPDGLDHAPASTGRRAHGTCRPTRPTRHSAPGVATPGRQRQPARRPGRRRGRPATPRALSPARRHQSTLRRQKWCHSLRKRPARKALLLQTASVALPPRRRKTCSHGRCCCSLSPPTSSPPAPLRTVVRRRRLTQSSLERCRPNGRRKHHATRWQRRPRRRRPLRQRPPAPPAHPVPRLT